MSVSDPARVLDAIQERVNQDRIILNRHIMDSIDFSRIFESQPKRAARGASDGGQYANTFVMETHRDVETVGSMLESIIFSDDPWFECRPMSETPEWEAKAQITEQVMKQQHKEMGFQGKLGVELRYFALFGTLLLHTGWKFRQKWSIHRNVTTGRDEYQQSPHLDQPEFIGAWLPQVVFDSNAEDVHDAEYVSEEVFVHPSHVRALIANNVRLKQSELGEIMLNPEINEGEGYADNPGAAATLQIRQQMGYNMPQQGRVSVLDYWGLHPFHRDPPIDWRIVIVNRDKVVVEMPQPYQFGLKPYLKGQFFGRKQSFLGRGLASLLIRPQDEVNDFRNLMRDTLMFQLYNMWLSRGGPNSRSSRFRLFPGKILDVAEFGELEPLRPAIEGIQWAIRLEEMTKEDMRFSSGATTFTQALPTAGTATESKMVASESTRRHQGTANRLVDDVVRPALQRQHELNLQFMNKKYLVSVNGRTFMAGREDLLEDPFFEIRTAADLDWRPVLSRRLSSAFQIITGAMQSLGPAFQPNVYPILAGLCRSLNVNPNEVIPPRPQYQVDGSAMPQIPPPPPPVPPPGMAPAMGPEQIQQMIAQRQGTQAPMGGLAPAGVTR